jgi:Cu(I)/Ag(I) efflux system protein CusF
MKILPIVMIAAATILSGPALAQMPSGMQMNDPAKTVSATGSVKKVDPAKRVVNLSHGPIPAISWPAMTMDFAVAPDVDLTAVKPGQNVEFILVPQGKDYVITTIKPKS